MSKKLIDKLAWIELKNKAILSTKSYGKDKYYIPGGKREMGETDEEALIREISEELSVTIDPATLQYMGTYEAQAHSHEEGIIVKMTCYSGNYSGELKASAEIEEMRWLNYSDKDKISEVDQLIFDDLHRNNLLN
ncbi:NUDIX domain-containing protein [Chryseobacterium lactis]|uniref:NUDIX hydrolase n=1 Tax=Chryseobacterium lactis TaxID=1241981 RepID=UPI001627EECE|nr:NUDIX domain-containing protein [Chryseobacterium lactis]